MNMKKCYFHMCLLRDTTFGRGDGIAGLIDTEIEHDKYGFPYMRGRTLKGLWSEACENLIYPLVEGDMKDKLYTRLHTIFGLPGSQTNTTGSIYIGNLQLPDTVTRSLKEACEHKLISTNEILNSVTTIRRQTSIDSIHGVAEAGSLRATRVIIRELEFISEIDFRQDPEPEALALLSAGAKALRYVGTNRNRGTGVVACELKGTENNHFEEFEGIING